MDIATVVGIVAAIGLIAWSILLGGDVGGFLNLPAIAIVVGGTLGALLVHFPLPRILGLARLVGKTFTASTADPGVVIRKLVRYAERARREGMLALEDESEHEPDSFLRKGLRLAVDGTDPQLLEKIMETDAAQVEARHAEGARILAMGGTFAPAFGMIGTLIGLVNMLSSIESPSQIGAGMAVALTTTFYGAVLANTFFIPMAGKLEARSREEMIVRRMVVDGIMAIQSGDSPRIVEEKLKSFLPPGQRRRLSITRRRAA